jgi:hypothetical protein
MGRKNRNKGKKQSFIIQKNENTDTTKEVVANEENLVVEEQVTTNNEIVEETSIIQNEELQEENPIEEEEAEPNIETIPQEEEKIVETEAEKKDTNISMLTDDTDESESEVAVEKSNKEREHLSDDRWIKKYTNKISHLFMTIDQSLTYPQDFKQLRGKMDEIMDYKTTGFAVYAEKKVREGHHSTVAVHLITEDDWTPVMEDKKCVNIPEGSEKITFDFHHDKKMSAMTVAQQYFTQLGKTKNVPGFLQYFLTTNMKAHDVQTLGKIEGFKKKENKIEKISLESLQVNQEV